jgi:hypothetical protein
MMKLEDFNKFIKHGIISFWTNNPQTISSGERIHKFRVTFSNKETLSVVDWLLILNLRTDTSEGIAL